jgi:hypothetical protein
MRRISAKLVEVGRSDGFSADGQIAHWCPACASLHAFAVLSANTRGAKWAWDGEAALPSFLPSMKITWGRQADPACNVAGGCCHYVLTKGRITFCPDCTHALAGQVVDLPDLLPRYDAEET